MPEIVNLTIYKGDTFYRILKFWDDVEGDYLDLTGCTPKAQIRAGQTAVSTLIAEFDCDLQNQVTDKGGVTIQLTAVETASLTNGFWDFQLTHPDTTIRTYLKGAVSVDGQVTT